MSIMRTSQRSRTVGLWLVLLVVALQLLQRQQPDVVVMALSTTTSSPQRAETRVDSFGGTGLFSKEAVASGETLLVLDADSILYGAAPNSPIQNMVEQELIESTTTSSSSTSSVNNPTTTPIQHKHAHAWSIAAVLAAYHLDQSQQCGLDAATLLPLADLPWTKAQWQLPVMWSRDVVDAALIQGSQQALSQYPDQETEILQGCLQAKQRVLNLQHNAHQLAQGLLKCSFLQNHDPLHVATAAQLGISLVLSRTCIHKSSGRLALLPVLDCANHAASPVAGFGDAPNGGVALMAHTPLQANDEITISYGDFDDCPAACFSTYGFVPSSTTALDCALQATAMTGQAQVQTNLEQQT